jgi:hypothetical protein
LGFGVALHGLDGDPSAYRHLHSTGIVGCRLNWTFCSRRSMFWFGLAPFLWTPQCGSSNLRHRSPKITCAQSRLLRTNDVPHTVKPPIMLLSPSVQDKQWTGWVRQRRTQSSSHVPVRMAVLPFSVP